MEYTSINTILIKYRMLNLNVCTRENHFNFKRIILLFLMIGTHIKQYSHINFSVGCTIGLLRLWSNVGIGRK